MQTLQHKNETLLYIIVIVVQSNPATTNICCIEGLGKARTTSLLDATSNWVVAMLYLPTILIHLSH